MYLTIAQAYNIYQILSEFADKQLPVKLSYKIMRNLKDLEVDINFHKERLQKLIDKYSVKDENGNYIFDESGENIKVQPDKVDAFNDEYKELVDMTIEIVGYYFDLSELEILEPTPKQLYVLEPFISGDAFEIEEEIYEEEETEE